MVGTCSIGLHLLLSGSLSLEHKLLLKVDPAIWKKKKKMLTEVFTLTFTFEAEAQGYPRIHNLHGLCRL